KIWYRWNDTSGVKIDRPRLRLPSGKVIDPARFVSNDTRFYADERGALWITKEDGKIHRLNFNKNGAATVYSFPTEVKLLGLLYSDDWRGGGRLVARYD